MLNLIYSIIPTIAFIVGFYFGFKVKKEDKLPEIKGPVKIIKEKKEEIKQEEQQRIMDSYIENIENYPYNQKDIKE